MYGTKKRTYRELQILILKTLKKEAKTIYDIAKDQKLHFHVVERQLILLKGRDYVSLAFERKRFRLYAITDKGMKYLRKLTR